MVTSETLNTEGRALAPHLYQIGDSRRSQGQTAYNWVCWVVRPKCS
jgi:hypothetical protein